jgi:serine/alanine adding enzyme
MATHRIKYAGNPDRELWDGYVRKHARASLFQMFGWGEVIRRTYGHATYHLMLMQGGRTDTGTVQAVVPLVHVHHPIFGNSLVSLPFFDGGGILADCREAEERLLAEAISLGRKTGAKTIELRHEQFLESCSRQPLPVATRTSKVRMLLDLPRSSEGLMKSFKSKLRSQVNKALKAGFSCRIGGLELLGDFYKVFLVNMRDLGSPVHSVKLMQHSLIAFPEHSKVLVIYRATEPVAAALVVGSGKILRNPWASSLRTYASQSPNMVLYLRMLEFACDRGYEVFDFGRSTPGEGTYKFKEQWGAVPAPLYWHTISLDGKLPQPEGAERARFELATRYWKKLPVAVTSIVGPRIRKYISL